ncbi:MAG: RNA polymerase sigma factor [Planctomycetota bacterium]|jgi:RNA polymerase sigma-70 factor (ECF subfamily)
MMEDKLLIWKFNRGNRDVLRRIYEKYKDDLVTLAAALLVDVGSAEDTVHDVFVSFIKSAEKFRLTGSLKGYLATCVANNARNKNKARQRYGSIGLDQSEPVVSDSNRPDFTVIFGEQLRQVSWALAQIPYEQREVLILHAYTGMKFKAIAARQDVSINTVQGRYRYAVDKDQRIEIKSQFRLGQKSAR